MKQKDKEKLKELSKVALCIAIGTACGIATYVFCLMINLAIFGWNLGLVLSPLVAGYVETYFAKRYLGETTGAVSAFILFLVTVIYGFILANPTLGLNAITIGSALIILQAAVPTLINYFLIILLLSFISYMSGIFKLLTEKSYEIYLKLLAKLKGETYIKKSGTLLTTEYDMNKKKIDINNLGILILSTTYPWNREVKEYKGFFEGKIIIKSAQREEIKAKTGDRKKNLIKNLENAKNQAILNLCREVKQNKGNCILDLTIEYERLGMDKGDNVLQIIASGTGVLLEKENEPILL